MSLAFCLEPVLPREFQHKRTALLAGLAKHPTTESCTYQKCTVPNESTLNLGLPKAYRTESHAYRKRAVPNKSMLNEPNRSCTYWKCAGPN